MTNPHESSQSEIDRLRSEIATLNEQLLIAQIQSQAAADTIHDLTQPMTMIVGYASVLEQDNFSPENKESALAVLIKNAKILNEIMQGHEEVTDILTGDTRKKALRYLAELAKIRHGKYARHNNVGIRIHIPETIYLALPDHIIVSVIGHFLSNALYFTSMAQADHNQTITVSVSHPRPGTILLTVTDTGTGLTEGDLIKTIVKGFSTKGTRGLGLSEIQAMTGKSPVVKNWFKKNGKVGGAKASIELETVPPPK